MKRLVAFSIALMVVMGLAAGCGDSREDLADDSLSAMKQLEATLATVKDEASAKAAKPKLQELADELNDINARMDKLGAPSEDEMKSMIDKHGKEMEQVQEKMVGHMLRITFDPKIQAVLDDIDFKSLK